MSDKTKIILIYTSVALICAIAVSGFITLGKLYDLKAEAEKPLAVDVGKETAETFLKLEKNLHLTNQNGEPVSLFDLKGKVWVFAQFFAKCPMCAERNYTDLLELYAKYKDHPDFMIICITVDPEADNVEKLQQYAQAVNADAQNWLFLTGKKEEIHAYMSEEMKFLDIRERRDPQEIATKGKYAHDLGLAVFDRDLSMRKKIDLAFARSQSEDLLKDKKQELLNTIEKCLKEKKN